MTLLVRTQCSTVVSRTFTDVLPRYHDSDVMAGAISSIDGVLPLTEAIQ